MTTLPLKAVSEDYQDYNYIRFTKYLHRKMKSRLVITECAAIFTASYFCDNCSDIG